MKNNTKLFSIVAFVALALAFTLPRMASAEDVFVPVVDGSGSVTSEGSAPAFIPATDESGSETSEGDSVFTPGVDNSGSGTSEGSNSAFVPVADDSGSNTSEGAVLVIPLVDDVISGGPAVSASNPSRSGGRSGGRSGAPIIATQVISPVAGGIAICPYINAFILVGGKNNTDEVMRLQGFLNVSEGASLAITGVYDKATQDAVGLFQVKYGNDILAPWNVTVASKNVYLTTKKKINELVCGTGGFSLTVAELAKISASLDVPVESAGPSGEVIIGSADATSTLATTDSGSDENVAATFFAGGIIEKFFKFVKGIFTGSN